MQFHAGIIEPMNALQIEDQTERARALADRAAALAPTLDGRAEATETAGQMLPETMGDLRAAGFTRLCQPRQYGGAELPLDAAADVIAALAQGCGSTAWVCAVYSDHSILSGMFASEASEDIWGQNPDALISAGYHPTGMVERAEGGWRVSGKWDFVSGCDYADWFILGSFMPLDDGGRVHAFFIVPRADIEIEDNWQVMGMQGTGSKNVRVESSIVPDHRMLTMPEANAGAEGRARTGGINEARPLYRLAHLPTVPFLFTATGLGIAESLYERSVAHIAGAQSQGSPIAAFPTMQMHIAEASAEIDTARLLVIRDCAAAMAAMGEGRPMTAMERARSRRDHGYATRLCQGAVDRLFAAAGAKGMFDSHFAQRKFRDMRAVSTHISQNWDRSGTAYGAAAFGLD
jgi:alkylation response protein AidB-like acyl-CoA dehydrogenase